MEGSFVAATPGGKVIEMVAGESKEGNSIELRGMSGGQTIFKKELHFDLFKD